MARQRETKNTTPSNGGDALPSLDDEFDDEDSITQEDLKLIDAAFRSASKRPLRDSSSESAINGGRAHLRRRLPKSIVALQNPSTFSLSPCQENSKMKYPVMKFGGKIIYSRTLVEVEKASLELLKIIEEKRNETSQVAIGFDIEWKPTFRKGALPGKAAVMQICVDPKRCHVMHIFHSGIPKNLQLLLENSTISKVGVGIGNDAIKIYKDYNVSVEAVEELSSIANQKLGGDSQKWSLASLTENFVSKQLLKPKRIQLGNWQCDILSEDQLQYAATDAYVSWYLYQVLRTLPNIQKSDAEQEVKQVSPQ